MSDYWTGYWEQRGMGRQPMEDLVFRFDDRVIRGKGRDVIGRFTFAGEMDPGGRVLMNKRYIGQHSVVYQGQYDGEGTIFGEWSIGPVDRGEFVLRLSRGARSSAGEESIAVLAPSPRQYSPE